MENNFERIENKDSTIAVIINKTKDDIKSIYDISASLKNTVSNERGTGDYNSKLDKFVDHSQKVFDVLTNFLNIKKGEMNMVKKEKTEKEIEILDSIHTLKNNFGGFPVICEFLKGDILPEEEFKETTNMIFKEVQKSQIILENLKQDKLEEIKISEINLAENIKGFIGILKQEAKEKNININNQIIDETKVKADESKLESVLTNLIYNAIKFTNSGGNVSIRSEQVGNFVKIYIEDNGVGVPKEKQANFFNNFGETTLGTSGEKGTGIGVYTIDKLLKEMNGTINVESEGEGKGTTFIVTLPKGEKEIVG